MSTAGEAASLFGATDSAADVFGAPPDSSADGATSQSSTRDLFEKQEPVASAADFFSAGADTAGLFGPAPDSNANGLQAFGTQDDTWSGANYSGYESVGGHGASSSHAGYAEVSQVNGWSGQQQWAGYESQQYDQLQQNPSAYGTYTSQSHNAYQAPSGPYTPNPAPANPYAPQAQGAYAPSTTYAAYKPPAPTASTYAPPQPAPVASSYAPAPAPQSVYDPYKPTYTSAPQQPQAKPEPSQARSVSSYPVAPAVPKPFAVEPPPPPKVSTPTAAAFRPQKSNAYDPPLPPPKPRKTSGWHPPAPAMQPSYTMPTSPGLPKVTSPALPPPPRGGSAMRQFASPPPPPTHTVPTSQFAPPQPPPQQYIDHRYSSPAPPVNAIGAGHYGQPPPPVNVSPVAQYAPSQPSHAPGSARHVPSHVHPQVTSPHTHGFEDQWSGSQSHDRVHHAPVNYPTSPNGHAVYEDKVADLEGDRELVDHAGNAPPVAAQTFDEGALPTAPLMQEPVYYEHADSLPAMSPPTHLRSSLDASEALVSQDAVAYSHERDTSWVNVATPSRSPEQALHRALSPGSSIGATPASPPPMVYDPYAPAHGVSDHPVPPQRSPERALGSPQAAYKPNGIGSTEPRSRQQSPERARSPGSSSVRSWTGSQRGSTDLSGKKRPGIGIGSPPRAGPKPLSSESFGAPNAYDPPLAATIRRTDSPSSFSMHSLDGQETAPRYPYAAGNAAAFSENRNRSMSSSSTMSLSAAVTDPYAPSRRLQQSSELPSLPALPSVPANPRASVSYDRLPGQVLTLAPPTHTPYAPSPSLLGTNDPLGRAAARIPVINFGFGGKIVTCFHGASGLNTGFDVALSSRQSRDVHLRLLHQVIPESALDSSAASYPGPLFSDPGTPSTSLVRTGAATQAKTKKTRVVKYLEERAEEIAGGIGYLNQGSAERKQAEAKGILVNMLKIMVENDGHLSGSSQIDAAVRAALVPRLGASAPPDPSKDGLKTAVSLSFPHHDIQQGLADLPSLSYPGLGSHTPDPNDATVAVTNLRSSHLDRIQDFLLRGERRTAFQYAADEKLWAHAMLIASSIDKEAWKEVVSEFVRAELTGKASGSLPRGEKPSPSNGREPLRVAYSLFAGQGAAAVQEFLPPKSLMQNALTLPLPPAPPSSITPMTPNFPVPPPVQTGPIPVEVLSKWAETAAMMISSPMSVESSAALTSLGDHLMANNWVEAAHTCYLLSPQTSLVGGVGSPTRVVLFGAPSPSTVRNFWKNPDAVIFSEIAEFAMSLATPPKGQEPFAGLPHLQPFRLIRAAALAEMGHVQLANRYCDAISACLSRSSPYINNTFVEQLKLLTDRLVAAPHMDKSGSWISSKMAKPSLDKIGNWLEGRLTSFIAGAGESPLEEVHPKDQTFGGPFAHYSTISSTTTSALPSPTRSTTDLTEVAPPPPPFRTGSAMALRSSANLRSPVNRSSSAMDYVRRKPSPVPRVASATAATFSESQSFHQPANGFSHLNGLTPKANGPSGNRLSDLSTQEEMPESPTPSGPQLGSWWGSPDSGAPTPTASTFHAEVPPIGSSDGFISLMDDSALSATPVAPPRASSAFERTGSSRSYEGDDEDDLGLGNASRRANNSSSSESRESSSNPTPEPAVPAASAEKSESKPGASGSWISRLWRRGDTTPAPIKANLGEQTSFYYDKDLKRWVNKNAGDDAVKSSAPPPAPPRAQTASPGHSHHPPHLPPSGPPTRPATAIDLSNSPPGHRPPMRIRSNLVPNEAASAPPTAALNGPSRGGPSPAPTPTPPPGARSGSATPSSMSHMDPPGLNGPPPPGARAKAGAKRGNLRNRYVDVFQQQGS